MDVTDSCSAGRWRELLAGAGARSATITGSGIFKDTDMEDDVRRYFFDGVMFDAQFIIPSFGIVEGPWAITSLDYAGEYNGEVTFSMTFESAGQLIFTADSVGVPGEIGTSDWAATTGVGAGKVNVNVINLPSDGGSALTKFQYTVNGGGTWTDLPGGVTTGTKSITLTASTTYGIALRAVNGTGDGPQSISKSVTSGA